MTDGRVPGQRSGSGRGGAHSGRAAHDRVHDIVTPTPLEARNEDIARRRCRYFRIMIPCLVLVGIGFYVPAPTAVRVAVLAVAAVLPPIAAIVANTGRRY